MTKKLAQVAFWMWLFPCMVIVTGFQSLAKLATFLVHAPMIAWDVASETINEQ